MGTFIRWALYFAIIILLGAAAANAATLSWTPPTTYEDGSAIGSEADLLLYHPYYGPSATGPWTAAPVTGATSATVPEPAAGETLWYTVSCSLDTGPEGQKAAAIPLSVPFPQPQNPGAPSGLTITR